MARLATIERTRNLGIMAHIDAGKTTTTERILYYAGVTSRMGEVHDGSTVTDWMTQEQERGISITAASTTFSWRDYQCNLVDTPGHVDFTVEVERCMRVLDGAVVVFCAVHGVEPQSETVWRQADRYAVPRIAFINKCDRVGADPGAVTSEMRTRLNANPIVLHVPHALEDAFNGLVDLVHWRSREWDDSTLGSRFRDGEVPVHLRQEAAAARGVLVEAIAEVDDELMAKFLADDEISPADILAALRRATIGLKAVPVVLGSALTNKGVQFLLDAIVDLLPSPIDRGATSGVHPDSGERVQREVSDDQPTSAVAFKIMNDPQVGPLTYLRVYSGRVQSGDQLLNATRGKLERVGRLVRMHANRRGEVKEVAAGDIGAAIGMRTTATGDTLCDPAAPIVLDTLRFPDPVIGMAIEPSTLEEQERLERALEALAVEDPTFRVSVDPESQQTIISGMGELHLEILRDRLEREFHVQARVGRPQVAYRETVTARAEADRRFVREVGGRGQYGHVRLAVEPARRGAGVVIDNRAPTAELPKEFLPAVRAGVAEAAERGVLGGFPMIDLAVTLLGGSHHQVDSSDAAFKTAAFQGFREAAVAARPVLVEPVMSIEVVCPVSDVGDVIGDLSARRGKITGIETRSGVQVVAGLVPLASMFGYATDLRSRTQGRATFSMQFQEYAEMPSSLSDEVVAPNRLNQKLTGA
jgi:elongation factor G